MNNELKMESEFRAEGEISSDALLQASRRIDWRFLLPDPTLAKVAYIGPGKTPLLESLRRFSEILIAIEGNQDSLENNHNFDVLVIKEPASLELNRAVKLVKPGGYIYIEGYGGWQFIRENIINLSNRGRSPFSLRWPKFYSNMLGQKGYTEIQTFWHWPDFESCKRIIPLNDHAVIEYVLFQGKSHERPGLFSFVEALLRKSTVLERMISHFSIVGVRSF